MAALAFRPLPMVWQDREPHSLPELSVASSASGLFNTCQQKHTTAAPHWSLLLAGGAPLGNQCGHEQQNTGSYPDELVELKQNTKKTHDGQASRKTRDSSSLPTVRLGPIKKHTTTRQISQTFKCQKTNSCKHNMGKHHETFRDSSSLPTLRLGPIKIKRHAHTTACVTKHKFHTRPYGQASRQAVTIPVPYRPNVGSHNGQAQKPTKRRWASIKT
jgi:hypothetical protein